MKNYSWEYFNVQINQKLSERKAKPSTVKEKLMWSLFWNYETYFEFHSKVRSRDK